VRVVGNRRTLDTTRDVMMKEIKIRFRGNPVGLWALLDELKAERLDLRLTPPCDPAGETTTSVEAVMTVVANTVQNDAPMSTSAMKAAADKALQRWRSRNPRQDAAFVDADD